jgi:signal transduction histidine kinase
MPIHDRRDNDLQTFLHGELEAIVKKTGADYAFIGVVSYRAGSRHIVIRDRFNRSHGAEAGDFRTARASFKVGAGDLEAGDRSFVGHVAAIGEPQYAPDVTAAPYYHPGIGATCSEHALPVKLGTDVLAVLNLESRHLDGFPAKVRQLAEEWARAIAPRLHQEMVRAGLRRSERTAPADGTDDAVRLVSTLRRLLDKLSRALVELRAGNDHPLTKALDKEALDAAEALGADVVTLYLFDEEKQELSTPPITRGEIWHPEAMDQRVYSGDLPWIVMRRREPAQYWRDVQRLPQQTEMVPTRDGTPARQRFAIREGIRSACGIRLEVAGTPSGVLFLNFRSEQSFESAQCELIETYAGHLSFAMELVRVYRRLRAAASQKERHYLDMELHDGALYGLVLANVACGTARVALAKRKFGIVKKELQQVEHGIVHANEGIDDMRTALNLPALDEAGLVSTLKMELGLVRSPRIDVTLPANDPPLPLEAKHAIRRIVQTAVRNIVSHARATHASVALAVDEDAVRLTVADDGIGFNVKSALRRRGCMGLAAIQERVKPIHGRVSFDSVRGRGTTIAVVIPVRQPS